MTARSANDGRSGAPAYVHEDRTPATIMSSRSSTPGRAGSRYIRAEEIPSSNSSLRARSYAESDAVRTRTPRAGALGRGVRRRAPPHRARRRHAEALLVQLPVRVAERVTGRLVRAGEPRPDHD